MSKIITLPISLSLILVSTVFAPATFAADVETIGDLKVQGVIESTSGGFKFPDGTTMTAAGMNGLLFNHGFVVDNSGQNIGNLTSGAIKFGAGDGATGEGIASTRQADHPNLNGLDFYTDSTSRLAITNGGFVGIGTRTPQFQLTESNSANGKWTRAQFGHRYPLYLMEWSPAIGFNAYWDAAYKYGSSHPAGMLTFDYYTPGGFDFMTAPSGTGGTTATMTTRLSITNDGKVGIGTTTPSQKLDVIGNINSSGTLSGASLGVTGVATVGSVNGVSAAFTGSVGGKNVIAEWGYFNATGVGFYAVMGRSMGSGNTTGVEGEVSSANGIGGKFTNDVPTGKAISAIVNGTEVMKADATGIHAGSGMTGTPLAYGTFQGSDGARRTGSSNINCSWNSASSRNECTITDENYGIYDYVVNVTPIHTSVAIPRVDGADGKIHIYFYNIDGNLIQSLAFGITVYKQ